MALSNAPLHPRRGGASSLLEVELDDDPPPPLLPNVFEGLGGGSWIGDGYDEGEEAWKKSKRWGRNTTSLVLPRMED